VNTSGSATNTIQVVNLQSSGIYTVIGRAVTGCTNVATGTLNTIPLPIITTTGTTVCFLEPATLAASGGTPNAYTWRGPGGYSSSSQNAYIPSATSAAPQTYTVVGTAANSCTNSATAVLKTYPLPRPVYNATANVCVGDYVTLQAYGAVTYTWAGPRNFRSLLSEVSFPTYSLSQSGDFTLTVIDSLGCRNYTTANVIVNALPEGNLTSNNDGNFCVPYCADFSIVRTTPNPIITTNWSLYGKKTVGDIFKYCASNAASNTVVCVFTDALGCTNTHSFEIAAYPTPTANFLISAEKAVESIDEVLFTNNSTGQQITNNNWFFIETGKPISSEKNASFLFENAGQYAIALMVTNTWGCSDTTVKSLIVESDFKIFVPNAFTPNFDGLNDFFQPKGRGLAKYTLEIFDRWGNKIFFSDEFEKPWDGKLNGDNCLNDVYGWRIFITDVKGQKHDLSGQVTLIR
jgi:gliding motility-associated-like protein